LTLDAKAPASALPEVGARERDFAWHGDTLAWLSIHCLTGHHAALPKQPFSPRIGSADTKKK